MVFPPPATPQPSLLPAEDEEEKVPHFPATASPYVPNVTNTSAHTHTQPPVTPPPETPPPETPQPKITITPQDIGEPEKKMEEEEGMTDRGKKRDATEKARKEIMVTIYKKKLQSSGCIWLPPLLLVCLMVFFILNV